MSGVGSVSGHLTSGFVRVGHRDALSRLLAEYGLANDEGQAFVRTAPDPGGPPRPQEYLVHESVLRSQGQFPCAGDAQALSFCRQIVDEMVGRFGVAAGEAVARINRHWSESEEDSRTPRVWIVGADVVYHETAEFWAHDIYYGPDSRWWVPGTQPGPLPLP